MHNASCQVFIFEQESEPAVPTYRTTCPLNCWDQCSLTVYVENGCLKSIGPDPAQKITGSFICSKGKKHIERATHPRRLTKPLLRSSRGFREISWKDAISLTADHLNETVTRHGPLSILHYFDGGHAGVLKNIESRFFSALGGCTTHSGSLCWSAGLAAQHYDFGGVLSHSLADLTHSRMIIMWGRNPADTALHQLPFIRQARENGARVVLIDPICTATAAVADHHIGLRPATDGALALGVAHLIIREGLHDREFVQKHSSGFASFQQLAAEYPPETVARITGVPRGDIVKLAREYASAKPAAILLGYGLQRHSNGGNTVRAVDALAALTGNIGVPGGGASYANFQVTRYLDHAFLSGDDLQSSLRRYPKPALAESLARLQDPPVKAAYISRANPLLQAGDSRAVAGAFRRIPFVVVSELFMTDTAAAANLVLPCTSFLEQEDLYCNSMHNGYLGYGPKLVEPPGQCRHEYAVLRDLAKYLRLEGFPMQEPADLLRRIIRPLTAARGVTLEQIKEGPLLLPGFETVPWQERRFNTPDGKYNFFSQAAEKECGDPLPRYRSPVELGNRELQGQGYRYWFATPHPSGSIHSAHRLPGTEKEPQVHINPQTARAEGITDGEVVLVESPRGSLEAKAKLDKKIPPEAVLVYEGWWHASGAAVNNLTPDRLTDLGEQAALYDCLCRITGKGVERTGRGSTSS